MKTDLIAAREALADEWTAASPRTDEEIALFYQHAGGMEADLNIWHESAPRQDWTGVVVAAAMAAKAQRILDVGAGTGHDLRALRAHLPGADLAAVEPNDKFRERLNEQGIPAFATIGEVQARDLDMINCIDVLEHVPDPEALLLQMIDRLRMGGVLVEATATHDAGTPLHLDAIRGWKPNRLLDRYGFVLREQSDRLHVWQRMNEKRIDQDTLLLCAYRSVSVDSVRALIGLVSQGWRYQIHSGDALISRVRSIAVSKWLRESDGDVFLMVDDDIVFSPADAAKVVALAREKKSIACAAYPVRGGSHFACRVYAQEITFGPEAPPVKIQYAGTGFIAVHREVAEAIAATMPLCHETEDMAMWPLFQPFVAERNPEHLPDPAYQYLSEHEYLSEDWAFCHRAKQLGYDTWLDPSVILTHIGAAQYDVYTMQGAALTPPPTDITGA